MTHEAENKVLIPCPLEKAAIGRAYPLVRNIAPSVTLEQWQRFAQPKIGPCSPTRRRGLMSIQNPSGYILGLFGFEIRDELGDGPTLCMHNIIVPNVPGRGAIWASIAGVAETLAKDNGCGAVRADVADDLDLTDTDRAWVVACLEKSGYAIEGIRAVKRIAPAIKASPRPKPL